MLIVKFKNLNYLLIITIILIAFIGAAGLYSAAGGSYEPLGIKTLGKIWYLVIINLYCFNKYQIIYKYSYIIFILSLLLLFSVELIGVFGKGATRWISIFRFNLQPSELIKIRLFCTC